MKLRKGQIVYVDHYSNQIKVVSTDGQFVYGYFKNDRSPAVIAFEKNRISTKPQTFNGRIEAKPEFLTF